MSWHGGFSHHRLTREEFVQYVNTFSKQNWIKFLVLHNTGAPDEKQARNAGHYKNMSDAFDNRMDSFENYYEYKEHWSGGPHAFSFEDGKIGCGTPLNRFGTHSPSWNECSLGLEMVANFVPGDDDPLKDGGHVIYDTAAFIFATWLKWLGLPANNDTIKLHKEDHRTTHDCPGSLVHKDVFIKMVQDYMK